MATQTQIQANRRSDRVSYSSGLAFEAKRGAGFAANTNTNSFKRLPRHVPSFFNHLGELARRRARRRQQSGVDSSVTDSPGTENPEIGFVSHTTPNPSGPASAVDRHAAQHASLHDPATAPATTHSPQPPNPEIGFVSHTTYRPSAPLPSAAPHVYRVVSRPRLPRTHGWGMDSPTSKGYRGIGSPYLQLDVCNRLKPKEPQLGQQRAFPAGMALPRSKSWLPALLPVLATVGYAVLAPHPAQAIPAFARKFGVKCYSCHTVPPALNKTGYTFKRLGYRMPPDEMDGTKPAPKISELDKSIKFSITNSLALIGQGSFTADKTKGDGITPTSSTSFNLDEVAMFAAGSVPDSGFSYFTHLELSQDGGSPFLEQAVLGYTAGRANSSYFIKAGQMHMQEGEGTRASMFYNLFPDPAPLLTTTSPINFTLDQHPVGINLGYTWASNYFKHVFAISAKVTNGLNADGSEIIVNSTKNSKDYWVDADYWFGPDGGVTFMTYQGTKDQVQNQGADNEFTYRPRIRRYGFFGNYLFFDKLDVLGGYLRSSDDWQDTQGGPTNKFTSNGYRAEVDYYLQRGFAVMARYDRMKQSIAGGPATHNTAWSIGSERALTEMGNVVIRATYGQERDQDPVSGAAVLDKLFKLDLRLMW
jgi:hypothetical protein